MLLFCPRCQTSVPGVDRCPQCDGRLATPNEAHASAPDLHSRRLPEVVRPSAAGRLMIGVLAGLGLFVGLREWATAGLLLAEETWRGPIGLAVAGSLKVVASAVAGVLAGTGRPKGAGAGLTAGVLVGALLLMADRAAGAKLDLLDLATVAGLTGAAAAGGAIGSWRWPAPHDLPPPPTPQGSSLASLIAKPVLPSERPLQWGRVVAGGLIGAAGIALADPIRESLRHGSAGSVGPGGTSVVTLVDLQLAGLFVMLGGAVAGATTGVGPRHGVLAGVCGGLLTVWMPAAGVRSVFPVVEGLLKMLGLPTNDLAGPGAAVNLFIAVLVFACFGGWLGGVLLPPVVGRNLVKKRLAYT